MVSCFICESWIQGYLIVSLAQYYVGYQNEDISDENQSLSIIMKHLREAGKLKSTPMCLKPDSPAVSLTL